VRALRAQMPEDARALFFLRARLSEAKAGALVEERRRHDLVIERLQLEIEDQVQIGEDLAAELEALERPFAPPFEGENPRLLKELKKAVKRKQEKSVELARLAKEQEQEEIIERLRDEIRAHNLMSLFLGWFERELTVDEVSELCEKFGEICEISIGTRNHRGESRHCAYVSFENNAAAARAIGELNGIDYQGARLIAVWNDEQPPAPPSERSRAGPRPRADRWGQKQMIETDSVGWCREEGFDSDNSEDS
jgi:RNA recognition motif-containing protein